MLLGMVQVIMVISGWTLTLMESLVLVLTIV